MKRCIAILCAFLVLISAAAPVLAEPMPQDTPLKADGGEFDMLAVDHRLYELGYRDAECNGEMDEVTINALRKFQSVNGLEPTGNADEKTVRLLMSEQAVSQIEYLSRKAYEYANMVPLEKGAYGDQVVRLQKALQNYGYFSGKCDGAYGDATQAAVRRFQMANGLKETGIADGTMFMRLYDGNPLSWEEFIEMNCASVGDAGDHVRLIQLWLKKAGCFSGECTGRYGEGTQQAVKDFQLQNGLEPSGDVDGATSRLLFTGVASAAGEDILARGSTDERIDALCMRLNELGYGAHAAFDLQTELALMKYQHVNGMEVSGTANADLLLHMESEAALAMEQHEFASCAIDADGLAGIARKANAMLGQMTQLDQKWNFVEYLFLNCGYPLPEAGNMGFAEISADEQAESGSVLRVIVNEQEIYGIAAMDGAIIYQGDEGYIIVSYLDMLEADRIYAAGLEAEDAA